MRRLLILCAIPIGAWAQSSGVGSNWTAPNATLQNAATANGNGSTLALQGLSAASFTVNCSVACTGGTTITFQGSQDGTNFSSLSAVQAGTSTIASTVVNQGTTPTVWFAPVSGLQTIRAVISAYSAGTITVTATGVGSTVSSLTTNTNSTITSEPGTGTAGAAVPSTVTYIGGNGSGNLTAGIICDHTAVYDTNTSGATQLVALVSGKVVYVCGFNFTQTTTTAVNVDLVYGTGTNCATGLTKMTPAYPLQAASSTGPVGIQVTGPALSNGLQTAASNELCINTNAAVAVQALVWYTQF